MSTRALPLNPKITVIFQGFVVTRIHDGAPEARIGALKDSDCHKPRIGVKEIASDGAQNPVNIPASDLEANDNFSLSVENTSASGISVFQKDDEPFNRLDDENDRNDFRWFLDLDDLHRKTLARDDSALFPVITLNNGLFYTRTKSPGEVRIKRLSGGPSKRFGQFGLEIAANIYFDKPNSKAVFKKGNKTLFAVDATSDSTFEIVINCNCDQNEHESDFPLVYGVVNEVSDPEKFDFEGDLKRTGFDRNPEVYCVGGN